MGQIAGGFRQQLLGEWLTHRFLGALEQGAELGEQIRAGLLQELGLAFLAAQLLSHLRHRCQGGVVAGLERIPLLAYALQLGAADRPCSLACWACCWAALSSLLCSSN